MLGLLCAGLACMVAAVYIVIVPSEASDSSGLQKIILLYSHALCWIFLSGASVLWALRKGRKAPAYVAYAALAVYVLFMVTLLMAKNNTLL